MLEQITQKITRRKIQIVLGLLWLLDGCLQLQHQMFSSNFASDVIAPSAQGQPRFVSSVIHFSIRIFLTHPAIFNSFIFIIQSGLGIAILWKRTAKYGLMASVAWGLFVWYAGEGLGGLAGGHALLLMGAPGAALLYAIIALGVMPIKAKTDTAKQPASWLAYIWLLLWLGSALLLLWSKNTTKSLSTMIAGMASGAPGWMAALDYNVSLWLKARGNWLILVAVLLYLAIGLMALLPRYWRLIAIKIGVILLSFYWIVGQSMGGYFTGLATDPGTAPLIILLGIALLGTKDTKLDIT
ncbi:MAG TPA: hypothetical protein VMR95_02455 [Candidatus Binatia bacterium]|nr:hypothetical protein [Candidatus Binatia bacterium]